MANSAMQKLNNNIHYDGTTKMNSNNVLLKQDGSPSHTAKHHQIPAKRKSPLSSLRCGQQTVQTPDLNLVDYAVWGALQQRVYYDDCLKLWNS